MLLIRNEQLQALEEAAVAERLRSYAQRLRAEHPGTAGALPPAALAAQIEEGQRAANALGYNVYEHVYRFIRLRYLPDSAWEHPQARVAVYQVLVDTGAKPAARLDFAEHNLGPRPLAMTQCAGSA